MHCGIAQLGELIYAPPPIFSFDWVETIKIFSLAMFRIKDALLLTVAVMLYHRCPDVRSSIYLSELLNLEHLYSL